MIMAALEFEIVLKESNYQITSFKLSIYTVKTKLQRLNPNYLIYMKSCKINVLFKTVHISSSNLLSKTFGISKRKCSYETCIFSDSELTFQHNLIQKSISNISQHNSDLNTKYMRRHARWDQNLPICEQNLGTIMVQIRKTTSQ